MSAIGGILLPAGPAPSREIDGALARMSAALADIGPDGRATAVQGRTGMLYRPLSVSPQASAGRQPHVAADGLLVTWDGRLDNRGDVVRGLEGVSPSAGDAEVVAAGYRRWGRDVVERLVGDFALAVWDPQARALLLARDPFGTRPLFYDERGGAVAWASTLRALLAALQEPSPELDREWIAGYLTDATPEGRTPYRRLRAVPPAAAVVFTEGRCDVFSTWPPAELPDHGVGGDREAEERFRDLFFEAVRCRLRNAGPVFCELSGGVDSSSIACVADRLLRDGAAGAGDLETVSWVFDGAASSDERPWIRQVEARTGRRGHHLREEDDPLLGGFEDAWFEAPSYLTLFHLRHRRMRELARRAGCRVVLSGIGGDNLLWSEYVTPPQLADLAAAGRFAALAREVRTWREETRLPYGKLVWSGVARPLWRHLARRSSTSRRHISWLGADLDRCRRDLEPAPDRGRGARWSRPSQRQQLGAVRFAVRGQIAPAYLESQLMAVELRFPFLHRPLVEFCLALPAEQFARPGETRSLHRRALRSLLPPEIATRRCKRGPDEALIRRLGEAWPRLTAIFGADARVFANGFVERAPFLESLRRRRFGVTDSGGSVEAVFALEVWLRGLDGLTTALRAA